MNAGRYGAWITRKALSAKAEFDRFEDCAEAGSLKGRA